MGQVGGGCRGQGGHRTHSLGESRKGIRRCCLIRAEFKKPWQRDWRGKGGTPTKWKSAERGPVGRAVAWARALLVVTTLGK